MKKILAILSVAISVNTQAQIKKSEDSVQIVYDTIPVIMLVSDTSIALAEAYNIKGFEVLRTENVISASTHLKAIDGLYELVVSTIVYDHKCRSKIHVTYLNKVKQPLVRNYVWQAVKL